MDNSNKKIKKFFEKLALILYKRSILVLLIFVIISIGAGFAIFQILISNPLEKEFDSAVSTPTPNYDLLDDFQKEEEASEDPFIDEEDLQEEDEETVEETAEELEVEEMTDSELETVLADNLFELYEFTDGELPSISERSLVWEDLGLGDREEYRGTYSQNILFLERLVEEID